MNVLSPEIAVQAASSNGSAVRPQVYVTRHLHFSAAHRLYNPAWSPEKNEAVFGLCNNPNWHGHNYEMEVTLVGTPDEDTGYVYDLGELKSLVNREVVDKLDHRNLNLDVDFMQGQIASTENLVVAIWNQLADKVAPAKLHKIVLWETPRNFVEYRGETFTDESEPSTGA